MSAPSQAEVKALLVSLLPPGSDWLKLDNAAYVGGTLNGLAGALKDTVVDRIEVLRQNCNPSTLTAEGLPEWEQAAGLAFSPIALFGTIDQRRNAVLAALRMSGSFSLDDIRSIVQPYFLYQDSSQIVILETDRAHFTVHHTYENLTPVTVGVGATGRSTVTVLDAPRVSPAGARIAVGLTTTRADRMAFALTGPDGFRVYFPPGWLSAVPLSVTNDPFIFFAPSFAGKGITGTWTLEFQNFAVGVTLDSWELIPVEGLGVIYDTATPPNRLGEGLGAGIFEYAVVADPALLGTGFDLQGAQRAITRWKPAHTLGVIASISPVTGTVCAIPDTSNAIPNSAIPC